MNILKNLVLYIAVIGLVFAYNTTAETEQSQASSHDVKVGDVENGKKLPDDEAIKITVKTDPESIGKGKNLFDAKCSFCHNPHSTETIVGPGLKGILKNPDLPVSKKPATPQNIANQIRKPYSDMPSFSYLSEDEVLDIIAFLNTL